MNRMPSPKLLQRWFRRAFAEARRGVGLGHGGPFGAVVVKGTRALASAHNTVLRDSDPTCHAEVNAIRAAAKRLRSPHLAGCVVIASSEPCPMCLTTAYWAQVDAVIYCLPRGVAAEAGFTDAFIYEDLARPPARRKVKVSRFRGLEAEGRAVFADWAKRAGKLY
jgi:tRNA(Arg) A34 adenosine deaminase TadA